MWNYRWFAIIGAGTEWEDFTSREGTVEAETEAEAEAAVDAKHGNEYGWEDATQTIEVWTE